MVTLLFLMLSIFAGGLWLIDLLFVALILTGIYQRKTNPEWGKVLIIVGVIAWIITLIVRSYGL